MKYSLVWPATKMSLAFVSAVCVLLMPGTAGAGDAVEGQQFARRVCSVCHSVGPNRESPMTDAPPFISIARSQKFKDGGVALLFQTHQKMPNFAFTAEQAEDVAAFIEALGRPRT